MSHARIDNRTPFAVEPFFTADEEGRPLLVPLVQATFAIAPGRSLQLLDVQPPVSLAGVAWGDDPSLSGYRLEPVIAFSKPGTDVVLAGHAQSPQGPVRALNVTFRVGALSKVLRVTGDRVWVDAGISAVATAPVAFTRIPLAYTHAFGGWDRSDPDPKKHAFEPRNPVGIGFRASTRFEGDLRLPNIEDPDALLTKPGQVVPPAGVSFISPDWQPRSRFAGTYDDAWAEARMPLLPADFNRAFFNAASPGLISVKHLVGNEPVLVEGASPHGRLSFQLPGVPAPLCRVMLPGATDVRVTLALDTVVVDTDHDTVTLLWRGFTPLPHGPHDVLAVEVSSPPRH